MLEVLGVLCLVQGFGGLVNRLADSADRSWFAPLYLVGPTYRLAACGVVAVAGLVLVVAATRRRARRRSPRRRSG